MFPFATGNEKAEWNWERCRICRPSRGARHWCLAPNRGPLFPLVIFLNQDRAELRAINNVVSRLTEACCMQSPRDLISPRRFPLCQIRPNNNGIDRAIALLSIVGKNRVIFGLVAPPLRPDPPPIDQRISNNNGCRCSRCGPSGPPCRIWASRSRSLWIWRWTNSRSFSTQVIGRRGHGRGVSLVEFVLKVDGRSFPLPSSRWVGRRNRAPCPTAALSSSSKRPWTQVSLPKRAHKANFSGWCVKSDWMSVGELRGPRARGLPGA
jgi:hypothetical protein